jgi:hypothetical protein
MSTASNQKKMERSANIRQAIENHLGNLDKKIK